MRDRTDSQLLALVRRLGVVRPIDKDYFDLRRFAECFEFDASILTEAIRRTFARRGTPIPMRHRSA